MSVHSINTRQGLPRRIQRGLRIDLLAGTLLLVGGACAFLPPNSPDTGAQATATPFIHSPSPEASKDFATRAAIASLEPSATPNAVVASPSPTASSSPEVIPGTGVVRIPAKDVNGPNLHKLIANPRFQEVRRILQTQGVPMSISFFYEPQKGPKEPVTLRSLVRGKDTENKGIHSRSETLIDWSNIYYDVEGFRVGDWMDYAYVITTGSRSIRNSRTIDWAYTRKRISEEEERWGFAALGEATTDPSGTLIEKTYATSPNYGLRIALVTGW